MATSSCSSSSSSISSLDDPSVRSSSGTIKFLCSHGGRILPRYPDGKLRYAGGETRVLAVDRSVPFSELMGKMGDLCGREAAAVHLRCQLPTEDLDALISVTSDEDLANLVEEYDLANRDRASPLKIRAFLASSSPPSYRRFSPPSSARFLPPRQKLQQKCHGWCGGGGGVMSAYRSHAPAAGGPFSHWQ